MHILVTGGAGYVGSHTVRWLAGCGHDVWVYDDLSRGHAQAVPPDCLIRGRLHDQPRLVEVLQRHKIEAVVHFAAYCLVGESVRQPARYWENNVGGTLALLESMRQCGVSRVVFSSTCAVYGHPQRVPITEDEARRPIQPYGSSKLACELLLEDFAHAHAFACVALRYFNAAGASADGTLGEEHEPETHLIPLVIKTALGKRASVEIFGTDYPTKDGTCIRDYVHVEDLAEAHRLALEQVQPGQWRVYNVGTGNGQSVREVIEGVRRVTGKPVAVVPQPRREGDPPMLVASAEKIRRELGWLPKYQNLEEILSTAWRWHQRHPDGYDA